MSDKQSLDTHSAINRFRNLNSGPNLRIRASNLAPGSMFLVLLFGLIFNNGLSQSRSESDGLIVPARAIATFTNQLRVTQGLTPVRLDPSLCRAAQLHAEDMAERNYFSHVEHSRFLMSPCSTPGRRALKQGYSFSFIAENICAGFPSPGGAFEGWVNSKPHYHNLVNPEFQDIGVGVALSKECRAYWVMLLGTTQKIYGLRTSANQGRTLDQRHSTVDIRR